MELLTEIMQRGVIKEEEIHVGLYYLYMIITSNEQTNTNSGREDCRESKTQTKSSISKRNRKAMFWCLL